MPDIAIRLEKTRAVLLATLGVMLLRLPVGWGIRLVMPDPQGDPALTYAALALQELLLWGLPALLLRPWRSRRLTVEKHSLRLMLACGLMGLMAQLALMTFTPVWVGWTGAVQSGMLMPRNGVEWVLAALALVVIPAVAEESFFRGALLTGLCESMHFAPAAALTTLIFALMHGSLAGFPAQLAVSLLCTLAMLTRGRLRAPIALHMCYNGAALLLTNIAPGPIPALPLALVLTACAMWMCGQIIWRRRRCALPFADAALMCAIILGACAMYLPEIL